MAGEVLTKPRESRAAHYADHYRQRWGSCNWRSKVHARARAAGMSRYSVWPAIQARFNNLDSEQPRIERGTAILNSAWRHGYSSYPNRILLISLHQYHRLTQRTAHCTHIYYHNYVTPTCCSPHRAIFRDCISTARPTKSITASNMSLCASFEIRS